jgi:hypothetical protein
MGCRRWKKGVNDRELGKGCRREKVVPEERKSRCGRQKEGMQERK